jgi:FemAB-related protein (PEP-CTERM system-associated)
MAVTCRMLTDPAGPAWDAFVKAHPDGTFFHLAAWKGVIERAFGHAAQYVMAEQDGAVTGVLPLVHVRSRLFGNALISNPFCVYGGPLAADRETADALTARACDLMQTTGVPALEFRFLEPPAIALDPDDGWIGRPDDLYVTFRKPIVADADANLKAIPRKQRAVVRKGIQNELTVALEDGVDTLHRVYAESVRNLGTPVFSRRYFSLLRSAFGADAEVLTVLDDGVPIASVLNFYFRDQVLPYYGGGTPAARSRAGNDIMYWEVMRRAGERGYRLFDFGRSKTGTGAYAFKKNWGFEPEPLHYRFRLRPGATLPDLNPLNPKYRLFIAAWKRLPVPVANLLGPPIVRGIG